MGEILIRYSFWFGKSGRVEKIYFLFCAKEVREVKEDNLQKADETPFNESISQHLSKVIGGRLALSPFYRFLVIR
jgi:hypothetical protein